MKLMIDIETNGTDKNNMEVLEVAILPILYDRVTGFYGTTHYPPFECLIHSDSEPKSDFAKKNQVELYKLCNELPPEQDKLSCRENIFGYFRFLELEDRWSRHMMGKNVVTFDLDILDQEGILTKSDYHYRIHEQTGGIFTLEAAMGIDRDSVYKAALAVTPTPIPQEVQKLGAHRAIYDCYEQLALENGLIQLIRKWRH